MIRSTYETVPMRSHRGGTTRCLRWTPSGRPRARVLAVHGLGSYPEYFQGLGATLRNAGIQLTACDTRGFGAWSGKQRWNHPYGRAVSQDVAVLARARAAGAHDPSPLFLAGDSYGALIAIQAAWERPWICAGVIGTSTFVLGVRPSPVGWAVTAAAALFPYARVPTRADLSRFTRDDAFLRYDRALGLGARWVGLRVVSSVFGLALRTAGRLRREAFPVPLFLGHGSADVVSPVRAVESLQESIVCRDEVFRTYEGGRHFLLNDTCAEQVNADILEFIEARVGRAPR